MSTKCSNDSTSWIAKSLGWSGGAKVLGKLPVPGRPTNLDYSRARAYCPCSRCRWGLFGHFFSIYHFSFLSPSLWETARYRLKYCLKGPLSPKQPKPKVICAINLNHYVKYYVNVLMYAYDLNTYHWNMNTLCPDRQHRGIMHLILNTENCKLSEQKKKNNNKGNKNSIRYKKCHMIP